ncbi:MAG: VWA domain-containing protein [Chloroflexota bacterium]|nr:VWA domain-containing protein [Actinomycetota bacterium]MDQ2830593.1 VWA domain-containing protein [Chloroflexota bacterium]
MRFSRHVLARALALTVLMLTLLAGIGGSAVGATDPPPVAASLAATPNPLACTGSTSVTLTINGHNVTQSGPEVDLVFLMDESGSITPSNFATDKTAISTMVQGLTVSPTRFGVGLVEFSGDARTGVDFSYNQASFLNGLGVVYQRGGSTNTYGGLVAAQQMLTNQGRPGAAKIIVTITDGDWNINVNQTGPELTSLKAAGDLLFGVGVGPYVSTANIELLSSKPEYAFPVADYSTLGTTLSHIAADIISPAAKNLNYSAQTTPDFAVTSATASSGTASHTANSVSWTLDQLATETVTVTYQLQHVGTTGGTVPIHQSALLTWTDAAGSADFSTTQVTVTGCDTSPPTTTAIATPPANSAGWNNGPVSVTLAATDPDGTADVAATTYTLDGGATQTYAAPFTVLGDGPHHITYSSVDKAGNKENPAPSLDLKIDSVAPTITGNPTPAANSNGWNNTAVTATFTCADNAGGSGIAACTAPVVLSAEGANQHADGTATDVAGNSATTTVTGISIDTTKPTTAATPARAANANGWYNAPVTVTLNGTDTLSGIATTTYSIDGGATQPYTTPVTVSGDGTHTIAYSSTDKAGNVEDAKTLAVKIDATAPKITAVATPASVWPPNHKLVAVSVAVSLTDSGSGGTGFVLVSATASGDPSDIQGFVVGTASTSGQVRANKDEVYTLTYKGTDKAGNSATVVVTIAVPHDQGH